jgi:sterol desaturase/sphingolipid hydroxylase (fatty acid hydroxylase superfamily)
MTPALPHPPFAAFLAVLAHAGESLAAVFLSPGSTFSLASLLFALAVSVTFLLLRRRKSRRRERCGLALLARALFPRRIWASASTRADVGFFVLNTLATGSLMGWALLSYAAVSHGGEALLARAFGPSHPLALPPLASDTLLTLALFLAYDFSYWVDHWLKHQVPLLWEFHRVHHTAEFLTPLTAFRVHPIDSLVFTNITVLAMGAVNGAGLYALGGAHEALWSGTNILLVLFVFAIVHLQHSHIDIRFGGWLGRLVFSPAHHHIHHSMDRAHFDSNLGSCLAVWDWMFGTLILPDQRKGKLVFGVEADGDRYTPHSITGGLLLPFWRAFAVVHPIKRVATPPQTMP